MKVWVTMPSGQAKETVASSIASWMCWPWPLRSRASSAAVTACAAVIAVILSGMMVRIMRGRPVSRSAWIAASPDSAWMIGS